MLAGVACIIAPPAVDYFDHATKSGSKNEAGLGSGSGSGDGSDAAGKLLGFDFDNVTIGMAALGMALILMGATSAGHAPNTQPEAD